MVRHHNRGKIKLNFKEIIWMLLLITFVFMAIVSLREIVKWYLNNNENIKLLEEISKETKVYVEENKYMIDFKKLKEKNSDTVAFLKVNGTNIEIPVVRSINNDFYLTHNFNKEYNSAGWIFTDYRNKLDGTDKNIVIYGHNTKGNTMFSDLKNIIKEEWYNDENNYRIEFITENEYLIYEVFSVYQIEKENYYIQTNFTNNEMFEEFVEKITKRSIKKFNVEVSGDDSLLTLSTCANNNKYRIVLHAKKIQD